MWHVVVLSPKMILNRIQRVHKYLYILGITVPCLLIVIMYRKTETGQYSFKDLGSQAVCACVHMLWREREKGEGVSGDREKERDRKRRRGRTRVRERGRARENRDREGNVFFFAKQRQSN